jgi:hypothetical protein
MIDASIAYWVISSMIFSGNIAMHDCFPCPV